MPYSTNCELIVKKVDMLMSWFSHTKKDIGYGYRWTFINGQRVDVIDYRKKWKTILRIWRGARLVRQFPVLYGRFDEVSKVIAKLEIQSPITLEQKRVVDVFKLLYEAPSGIGAFD